MPYAYLGNSGPSIETGLIIEHPVREEGLGGVSRHTNGCYLSLIVSRAVRCSYANCIEHLKEGDPRPLGRLGNGSVCGMFVDTECHRVKLQISIFTDDLQQVSRNHSFQKVSLPKC